MANHIAKLVSVQLETDESLSFDVQCCDDPKTTSRHHIYIKPDTTESNLNERISQHLRDKEAQHSRVVTAHSLLQAFKNANQSKPESV